MSSGKLNNYYDCIWYNVLVTFDSSDNRFSDYNAV